MGILGRIKKGIQKAKTNYDKGSTALGKAQKWAKQHLPDIDELFETPDVGGIFAEGTGSKRKRKRKKRR